MSQSAPSAEEKQGTEEITLLRHALKPEWGRAVLAWDRGDKRGYQFEDGKLRVFKQGFYDRLVVDDTSPEDASRISATLRRRLGWSEVAAKKTSRPKVVAVPVEQQVALFASLFPKGFVGARWAKEKRGIDTYRRLKRHRDAAIVDAARLFDKERLERFLEAEKHDMIVQSMVEVGLGTSFVSRAQLKGLEGLDERGERALAESLVDLLHGDGPLGIRFERFVDVLARVTKKRPTWQLTTLFLALTHPKEHICVKPGAMKTQALCVGRKLKVPAMPNAPAYERLLKLAKDLRGELEKAGYKPRDLVDIYDFIVTTTAPKALAKMKAAARTAEQEAA